VWPDNLPAVNAFVALSTQWRVGMSGPVGLDYGAIHAVLVLTKVERARWSEVFEDLRVMEEAALVLLRDKKK
jgi:hypothetical protein